MYIHFRIQNNTKGLFSLDIFIFIQCTYLYYKYSSIYRMPNTQTQNYYKNGVTKLLQTYIHI